VWLSTWFVDNYLQKCFILCPDSVSRLLNDVSTNSKLQNAVSVVVNWRLSSALKDTWIALQLSEFLIPLHVSSFSLTVQTCLCWMRELAKTDRHTYLASLFTAVVFLHVAHKIPKIGFTDELMDVLATIGKQFVSTRHHPSECNIELLSSKATKLMKVIANSSHSALRFTKIQLSSSTDLNTSELVELLQQSAVEHLTTFRQIEARDFSSVATIVTTDFEALYAYKRGDYQQCLQWSTHNVHVLLYANDISIDPSTVSTIPEFIQLMDDGIASLTALTLIINPNCREWYRNVSITQLTLSLYLMTQCQLKLRHSVTSLAQTVNYIEVAQRRYPAEWTLIQLTLKLTKCKVLTYIEKMLAFNSF